ncbi:MAG: hypothetical protein AAGI22_15145 [Planctomycetota bacterium]
MICLALASLLMAPSAEATIPSPASPSLASASIRGSQSFDDRYRDAKDDPDALWELFEWCTEPERAQTTEKEAEKVLRRLVALEPNHVRARKQLGHVREDGRWFENERALARYRRVADVEAKKARGFVRFRRDYVHPDAVPFLREGLRFDPDHGMWLAARDRRRLEKGWRLQDETWIRPDDGGRVDAGEWLVDDEWMPLERAERLRSNVDRMWIVPGPYFRVHATTRRAVVARAMPEMNSAVDDLRRVFGVEPLFPLDVCLLRTEEQYDRLAVGDAEGERAPTQMRGLHVVRPAYFAESWFVPDGRRVRFAGKGVTYWNEDQEYGDLYGVHNARLAAGLAYVEAIDPSPLALMGTLEAMEEGDAAAPPDDHAVRREQEKRLPQWLRWGGAVYAERFFIDHDAAADRSRTWPREWSVDNLRGLGGLAPLERVLSASVDPADLDGARKLLIERGLVVAYLVDGGDEKVAAAHDALKAALAVRDGGAIAAAVRGLEDVLVGQRAAILRFAGLEETGG